MGTTTIASRKDHKKKKYSSKITVKEKDMQEIQYDTSKETH